MPVRLALYQPDIPQNAGTLMRLAACLGVGLDIIEPCGFLLDDKRLRRAGMDYLSLLEWRRHVSWETFLTDLRPSTAAAAQPGGRRLVLLTTRATDVYTQIVYTPADILLVGRESAGVPETVHQEVDVRVRISMRPEARSLNVALAASIVLGEALRQTRAP